MKQDQLRIIFLMNKFLFCNTMNLKLIAHVSFQFYILHVWGKFRRECDPRFLLFVICLRTTTKMFDIVIMHWEWLNVFRMTKVVTLYLYCCHTISSRCIYNMTCLWRSVIIYWTGILFIFAQKSRKIINWVGSFQFWGQ